MKKYTLLTAMIALFTACSSDDSPTYYPPAAQTTLVSKESETDGTTLMSTREFTFDANKKLVSEVTNSRNITYTWTNGKITKVSSTNGTNTYETTYTYDANGQLASEEERNANTNNLINRYEYLYFADHYESKYYDSANEFTWRDDYYYDAAKKNIVLQRTFNAGGSYAGKFEYAFDNKPSVNTLAPYTQLPAPFRNANNRINVSEYTSTNELMESVDYTFELNNMGYPASASQNGFSTVYEYVVK